jgi:2-polyprenyl-3-methyl-5-hydroxy-6-metoxy-1,4-benzoquinol methylase
MAAAASPRRLESQRRAVRQSRVMPDIGSIINRGRWDQKHRDAEFLGEPAPFLVDCRPDLPHGRALDLACGLGANALYLAEEGFDVEALDWSFEALRKLRAAASEKRLRVNAVACDVTRFPLPRDRYDVLLCFRFLDRSLWPSMIDALRPGGALVLSTFNRRYLEIRPDFPEEFCVEEGELPAVFGATLRVERYQELPREPVASLLAFR